MKMMMLLTTVLDIGTGEKPRKMFSVIVATTPAKAIVNIKRFKRARFLRTSMFIDRR
jgi:hypothetical protein